LFNENSFIYFLPFVDSDKSSELCENELISDRLRFFL